jgi:branched-chain amino acid transport system permease protein
MWSATFMDETGKTNARGDYLFLAAVFLAVMGYALFGSNAYIQSMIVWIALNALGAVSLRFVLLIGEKNVATAAFIGMSAYATAVTTVKYGWPFPVSILFGSVVAGLSSYLFGIVCLRVKGPYFMLIGFSFTALLELIYTKWDFVGGNAGIVGIYPPAFMQAWMPGLVLLLCTAWIIVLYLCERSSMGRLFRAIRDNDSIVASVGIDIIHAKVVCLVLASTAVGFVGALTAFTNTIISPPDFQFSIAVFLLAYIMIGGQSHIIGTVIGATLLTILDQALQGHSEWEEIVFGGAIAASMLFLPDGLLGVWKSACSHRFWLGRSVRVGTARQSLSGEQGVSKR